MGIEQDKNAFAGSFQAEAMDGDAREAPEAAKHNGNNNMARGW